MREQKDVCPWQAGPVLNMSLRKLLHNPRRIMEPYLSEGMTAMDIGCAMGFFTLPMSRIVGEGGKVIAVDLQPQMLDGLKRNADKLGASNITVHLCAPDSLRAERWNGAIDFTLVFWMLHEVPDPTRLIRELREALSDDGKLLFVEPSVHVSSQKFHQSLDMIKNSGFKVIGNPRIAISRAAILQKI